MSTESAHFDMHEAKAQPSRTTDRESIPDVRRVNRTTVGSLAGKLDLSGGWDSPQTNTEIAADFGIASREFEAAQDRICPRPIEG